MKTTAPYGPLCLLALLLPGAALAGAYVPPVRDALSQARTSALGPSTDADYFELLDGDFWYGRTRVPVRSRALQSLADRIDIPPRADRDGAQWRLSAGMEATDNVTAAASDRTGATAFNLAPAVNWVDSSARHRLEADLSTEFIGDASGFDHGRTQDAASAIVNAYYRVSDTVALSAFDAWLNSHEPAPQTPVTAPGRYSSHTHLPTLGVEWQATARSALSLRWSAADNRSARPTFTDTRRHDLEAAWRWSVDETLRLGVRARERRVSYEQAPSRRGSAAWLTGEARLDRRLLASASLGMSDDETGATTVGHAKLSGVSGTGEWSISAERDVTEIGGLARLYVSEIFSAEAALRIGASSRLALGLQRARYTPREDRDSEVKLLRPRLTYTHALDSHTWIVVRYLAYRDEVPAAGFDMDRQRLRANILYVF